MPIPVVDQSQCIGCGLCVDLAPGTFELNAASLSEVINPTGDPEEVIQEAIDNCPVSCISWAEE